MNRIPRLARVVFALGMIGLGVVIAIYGDFALGWPARLPWRQGLVYATAACLLVGGAGLLFARTAPIAARLLLPVLLIWTALRVPTLVMAPQIEVNWLSVGEIAVLAAAAWALFAELCVVGEGSILRFATGAGGRRFARMLFAFSLLAFGLSHFFYTRATVALVPAWLSYKRGWAYLTGAGHLAAGLGVLFAIVPRWAAAMEAGMLTIFTVLVWVPAVVARSPTRFAWWEFAISWAITAGAWVMAGSMAEATAPTRTPEQR